MNVNSQKAVCSNESKLMEAQPNRWLSIGCAATVTAFFGGALGYAATAIYPPIQAYRNYAILSGAVVTAAGTVAATTQCKDALAWTRKAVKVVQSIPEKLSPNEISLKPYTASEDKDRFCFTLEKGEEFTVEIDSETKKEIKQLNNDLKKAVEKELVDDFYPGSVEIESFEYSNQGYVFVKHSGGKTKEYIPRELKLEEEFKKYKISCLKSVLTALEAFLKEHKLSVEVNDEVFNLDDATLEQVQKRISDIIDASKKREGVNKDTLSHLDPFEKLAKELGTEVPTVSKLERDQYENFKKDFCLNVTILNEREPSSGKLLVKYYQSKQKKVSDLKKDLEDCKSITQLKDKWAAQGILGGDRTFENSPLLTKRFNEYLRRLKVSDAKVSARQVAIEIALHLEHQGQKNAQAVLYKSNIQQTLTETQMREIREKASDENSLSTTKLKKEDFFSLDDEGKVGEAWSLSLMAYQKYYKTLSVVGKKEADRKFNAMYEVLSKAFFDVGKKALEDEDHTEILQAMLFAIPKDWHPEFLAWMEVKPKQEGQNAYLFSESVKKLIPNQRDAAIEFQELIEGWVLEKPEGEKDKRRRNFDI